MKIEHFEEHPSVVRIIPDHHLFGGAQTVEFVETVRQLAEAGKRFFIFDLSSVQVINSSGLGMLVSCLTTLRKFDATMVLAAVPDAIHHLLTITHLDRVFQQFPTTAAALEYYRTHFAS